MYGIFQMSLDRAVVLGLLEKNPAKVIGNVKKRKTTVDFWTKEEFTKVISTFYIDDLYQHFGFICMWLLFMTVMRLGEATALTWKDIDFENKNLRVNKTLYYKRAKTYEFVEPETASSISYNRTRRQYNYLFKSLEGASSFNRRHVVCTFL